MIIETVLNNWFDKHVVVVWIISSMKKLLHFPKQLLPVAIHQSVCIYLQVLWEKNVYIMFSHDNMV